VNRVDSVNIVVYQVKRRHWKTWWSKSWGLEVAHVDIIEVVYMLFHSQGVWLFRLQNHSTNSFWGHRPNILRNPCTKFETNWIWFELGLIFGSIFTRCTDGPYELWMVQYENLGTFRWFFVNIFPIVLWIYGSQISWFLDSIWYCFEVFSQNYSCCQGTDIAPWGGPFESVFYESFSSCFPSQIQVFFPFKNSSFFPFCSLNFLSISSH
jgi:hypothetical protein